MILQYCLTGDSGVVFHFLTNFMYLINDLIGSLLSVEFTRNKNTENFIHIKLQIYIVQTAVITVEQAEMRSKFVCSPSARLVGPLAILF